MESLLRFANHNSTHNSRLLSEACALDVTWALPSDAVLETALGSDSSPRDFANESFPLPPASAMTARGSFFVGILGYADGERRRAWHQSERV